MILFCFFVYFPGFGKDVVCVRYFGEMFMDLFIFWQDLHVCVYIVI